MIPLRLLVKVGCFAFSNGTVLRASCTVLAAALLRAKWCSSEETLGPRERKLAANFEKEEYLQEQEGPGLEPLDPDGDAFDRRVCARLLTDGEVGRTRFMRHWVAELRIEFPARLDRASDRAAMAKWLSKKLREHGMRTRHIADMVPRAVALAINPSRAEVLARQEADEARLRSVGGRFLHRIARGLGLAAPPPSSGC
jgi:hypothetical protein